MKPKRSYAHKINRNNQFWRAFLVPFLLALSLQAVADFPPQLERSDALKSKTGYSLMSELAPTETPIPAKPDIPALTRGEKVQGIEASMHFIARDLPRTAQPPSRGPAHEQNPGVVDQDQEPLVSDSATRLKKEPINPPSAGPLDGLSSNNNRSVSDIVRFIDGIDDTGAKTPDMDLAVGTGHIVEVVSSGFSIYTKLGTEVQGYTEYSSFLNTPAGWQGDMFSPRVVYDPVRKIFVMLTLGRDDVNLQSYVWISVSETQDPTEGWCTRRINVTNNAGGSPAWLDYAGLAVDAWGLYITGHYYFFSGGTYGASLRSYSESIFSACDTPIEGWQFVNLQWPSGGDANSLQPAQAHTTNFNGETFFVNTDPTSGDKVMLSKLSGDRGNSPSLTRVEIDIAPYNAINGNVDQPDTIFDIDGGSSNVMNAIYANGRVFFTLTDDVLNDGSSSGWLTVKLNTNTNTNEWEHLLWAGVGTYLFYPAITLQGSAADNNLAVFGNWTDAETTISPTTAFASGVVKFYANQPNDNSGPFRVIAPGLAPYVNFDINTENRWGSYSGAAYDWQCGHAWGVVESADSATQWNTTISAHQFSTELPCPLIELEEPAGGEVLLSGSEKLITWQSAGLPATDDIYISIFSPDFGAELISGPLPITDTSYTWEVPETGSDDVSLAVGSWTGADYTVQDFSEPFEIVDVTAPTPNPAGFSVPPEAMSISILYMEAIPAIDGSGDPVSYSFPFVESPTGGLGGSSTGWIAVNNHQDNLLETNHQYCYTTRTQDEAGNIASVAETECAYTLASAPVPMLGLPISDTRIKVQWDTVDNPVYTEYLVHNTTLDFYSGWITESHWVNQGLDTETSYSYRVRARNGDGVTTSWRPLGSYQTYATDADGDGIVFAMDNCSEAFNPAQRDTDADGYGNACDPDLDQNGVVNFLDVSMWAPFFGTNTNEDMDFNGDGSANFLDYSLFPVFILQPPGPSGEVLQNQQ